jgi:diguanylate cyclase (GGDEF)-like protein
MVVVKGRTSITIINERRMTVLKLIERFIERLYFSIDNNLALYDQLTGLYNYNWYDKFGKAKYQKKSVYITMIDLNNFKHINDTKGHEYANCLLQDIASHILEAKDYDPDCDIIRYGGDEFLLLSESINFAEVIDSTCNRLAKIASYGCYKKGKHELMTVAMEKADKKMYDMKKKIKKLRKER